MQKLLLVPIIFVVSTSFARLWPPIPLRLKNLPIVSNSLPRNQNDFAEFYRSLLSSNPGIIFGEYHGQTLAHFKQYLPILAELGVKVLFVEHMRSNQQAKIDRYNNGIAAKNEILEVIEDAGFDPPSHFEVYAAAHAAGIKIYGLDIAPPESGLERLRYTNPHWLSVIKKITRNLTSGRKFLAIVGRAHTGFPPKAEMAGIDVALGIPSVDFGRDNSASIYKCTNGEADYVLDLAADAADVATDRSLGKSTGCE